MKIPERPESYEDMAYELFSLCLHMICEDPKVFVKIYNRYPLLAKRFEEQIDKELESVDLPEETEEEKQRHWEDLKARIRAKYGEDAI